MVCQMSNIQYLTRVIEMDIGHRVMHEHVKCYSIHGHRVKIELTFEFCKQQDIGYCIDFKEIKRIGCQWLDDMMDHGFIANPQDQVMIQACQSTSSKLYLMSLNGLDGYCNPTAENICREVFMAIDLLFVDYQYLKLHHVRYNETPNCWVDTYQESISPREKENFYAYRAAEITAYTQALGVLEYDSRKL